MAVYKYGDKTHISAHFKASEFQCKCKGGHDFTVDTSLVEKLEKLYSALNCSSISVSSGFRCLAHDKAVGGSGTGQHIHGKAADICCYGQDGKPIDNKIVCCTAQDIGFTGIARIAGNGTYTHVDVRNGKWYGDETRGMNYCIPATDFYQYFGISREGEKAVQFKGIDVSAHQKHIDWSKVKTDFAILRAGYGRYLTQKDTEFEANYKGAKDNGIPVGAYWYSYAMSEDEARAEADVFLAVLKDKQFDYPVFYDVEESNQLALGKTKVSAIVKAFLEKVEKAGYWVGLYMSASPLTTHVSDDIKKRYTIWVANIGVTKPTYSGAYGLWQYSWKGSVNGITGDVDMDYSYQDYPAQIKAKGLNGYGTEPNPEPAPEPDVKPKKTIEVEMTVDGVKYKGTLTET